MGEYWVEKIWKYFWENKTFRLIWLLCFNFVYFKYRIDVHFIFIYLFKSIAEKYKSYLASLSRWSKDFYLSPGVFHVLSSFLTLQLCRNPNSLAKWGGGVRLCAGLLEFMPPRTAPALQPLSALRMRPAPSISEPQNTLPSQPGKPLSVFTLKYLLILSTYI